MNVQSSVPESGGIRRPAILCLGESMVLLASPDGTGLASAVGLEIFVAGAESNVARGLAHLGHTVEWYGRVGSDPFGSRILQEIEGMGVDVSWAVVDPERPTGVYFKDRTEFGSEVYYYRTGSAASAMSGDEFASLSVHQRQLCHVCGITAALSSTTDELLQRIVSTERTSSLVSFDVNYRPALWEVAVAGPRLLEIAQAADIVLVGLDEAATLWGTEGADEVRKLLPDVPELVVKDAGKGAIYYGADIREFVPALKVDVVESIGAGDAFAAGFLSGRLSGWHPARALRLGHVLASLTLQHVSDVPPLPAADTLIALASTPESEWPNSQIVLDAAETNYGRTPSRGGML